MNKLHLGLAISVIIGLIIASFPFYADHLAPYIWHYAESSGEEETTTIKGTIESSDPAGQKIVVDGKTITVKGEWTVETSEGTQTMESYELIESLLTPGTQVTVECTESGRWGLMAEEITGPGFHAYKG